MISKIRYDTFEFNLFNYIFSNPRSIVVPYFVVVASDARYFMNCDLSTDIKNSTIMTVT